MILTSLVRQVLFVVFGALGFEALTSDPNTMQALVSALVLILNSIWATWTRREKSVVAQASKIVPVPANSQKQVGIQETIHSGK